MECQWCKVYNCAVLNQNPWECCVFGKIVPEQYKTEDGCNCTKELADILERYKFKESNCEVSTFLTKLIKESYLKMPLLGAISSNELTMKILSHATTLIDIHFNRPKEIEEKEVYVVEGSYYGDPYAGYRIQRYEFDIDSQRVFEKDSNNQTKKIWALNELPVVWFFADAETLVFIGNGNIYDSYKQDDLKFDKGIFSDKPGQIKRIIFYTSRVSNSTLGLDLKGFRENWEQLPECIDALERMIEQDNELEK